MKPKKAKSQNHKTPKPPNPKTSGGFGVFWRSFSSGGFNFLAIIFRAAFEFLVVTFWRFFWGVQNFWKLRIFSGIFSGGDFFPGGIPNFLAVAEFPGGHFPKFSFPTTGSGVAGRGLCKWVEGSNPIFLSAHF